MRNSISESVSVATGKKKKKMYAQTNVVSNERNFFFFRCTYLCANITVRKINELKNYIFCILIRVITFFYRCRGILQLNYVVYVPAAYAALGM